MTKKTHSEHLYIYNFVISNPLPEVVDIMPELGMQVRKIMDNIWYISASHITHKTGQFLRDKTGAVATSFKRIPLDEGDSK